MWNFSRISVDICITNQTPNYVMNVLDFLHDSIEIPGEFSSLFEY